MSDWTAGYVADIGYTYGYYSELNPLRTRLAFFDSGLACPEISTACELGFGQGLSVNIHASGSPASWYGTDFNPSQAGFAQDLATVAGSGARLYDEAFAEFCARPDLPDFDYIALHGIWSWISDENRAVIVDFLRRKLKVGGVLYISYNTLPGWAAMVPMRHLLTEHAEVMAAPGRGMVPRIDAALDFADKLLATNPVYARANPFIGERIAAMKRQNRHYLAHEYFNRDWLPMHFADMAGCLESAKLNYACSAHYLDHFDVVNLTAAQQTFLKEIPDPMFRESVRDFMVNQTFRRDYWVKGARRLSPLDQTDALRNLRFVLVTPRGDVSLKVLGSAGEAALSEAIYGPALDALADHRPRTLGEVEQMTQGKGLTLQQLVEVAVMLAGKGDLAAAQDDKTIAKMRARTTRINQHLMHKARGSSDIAFLASPVTGGGIPVGRFQQLFLAALAEGRKQPDEWVVQTWQTIAAQGQTLMKDNKLLTTTEENVRELTAQAREFAEKQVPVLKALGIA